MAYADAVCESPLPLTGVCDSDSESALIHGDNLSVMASLLKTHREKFDLITIDPPFAVGMDFRARIQTASGRHRVKAYADKWTHGVEGYLNMMHHVWF